MAQPAYLGNLSGIGSGLRSDPFIGDPKACRFDPGELTCRDGDRADCLTEGEVATVRAFYSGPTDRAGRPLFYGWLPGSEATGFFDWKFLQSRPNGRPAFVSLFKWVFGRDWDWSGFQVERDMATVDIALGDLGYDTLFGDLGADVLQGGAGDDVVWGGGGLVPGADAGDWIDGGEGSDFVHGNQGDDTVLGGLGADVVHGGQGADRLEGEDGADTLSGDQGDDVLIGGAGADRFLVFAGGGVDRILDFDVQEGDRLHLDAGLSYTLRQDGADTIVDLGGGQRVVLADVRSETLGDGWIVGG